MRSINLLRVVCDPIAWIPGKRKRSDLRRAASRRAFLEPLESRDLLAADFGDAPDTGAGTGAGNYNTLAVDSGPSHTIVDGLRIGAAVDGDDGTLQNAAANADDTTQGPPDDENGLNSSAADLTLTIGAQPRVSVTVTNTTGSTATLWGWIDYNNNGVFDNVTERSQATVVNGTTDGVITLTLPPVPGNSAGTTYARFRLSTDAAAAQPTGAATDGEVEDYVVQISKPAFGLVTGSTKIANEVGGGPVFADGDGFGSALSAIGDLDGDGVPDMVAGAAADDTGGTNRGAIHVLFMNADGSAKSSQKIAHETAGGPTLANGDFFGSSAAPLGDLDGDGVVDLAVGAAGDGTGGAYRGAAHVLFMNTDGTVKGTQKIAHSTGGGPELSNYGFFGSSLSSLGDLDGDGLPELAVGAYGDRTGGAYRGAVHVLFLAADGTASSSQHIAHNTGGGPELANGDTFGSAVAGMGDLDGDGVPDMAVGAYGDSTGGYYRGALHVLMMNQDGTVKSTNKIAHNSGGGPGLANYDNFGSAAVAVGDLDGDGLPDLAVGAFGDDTGGYYRGAVHVLLMNRSGTVKTATKIADNTGGGPVLGDYDGFGGAIALLGDIDGDGVSDLAVGASGDDTGGNGRGAVHLLSLSPHDTPRLIASHVNGVGSTNRSEINGLSLQFDRDVTVSAAASLKVFNHTTELPVDVSAVGLQDNGSAEVSWPLSGIDFPDGYYTAEISNTLATSTDGSVRIGATHSFMFYALAGDGNGDRAVNFLDFGQLSGNFGQAVGPLGPGDFDGNGLVNFVDFGLLSSNFGAFISPPDIDYGDAPQDGTAFPTTLVENGARHVIGSGLFLGSGVDGEADGQPNESAAGDDNANVSDEDGVTFGVIQAGSNASVTVVAAVPDTAVLNAWIDLNSDGDWEDAGEQVFVDQVLTNGTNNLSMAIPEAATLGATTVRFRATGTPGYSYNGLAPDGEVEDYQVTIVAGSSSSFRASFPGFSSLGASLAVAATSDTQSQSSDLQRQRLGKLVAKNVDPMRTAEVIDTAVTQFVAGDQRETSSQRAAARPALEEYLVDRALADETDYWVLP